MPIFFIDTYVGQAYCPDRIGTKFFDSNEAKRTAFAALLDIAQDEDGLRTALDVAVSVRAAGGTEVFRACLTTVTVQPAERTELRHHAKNLLGQRLQSA